MAIIPNIRNGRSGSTQQAFVDTPNFLYSSWLSRSHQGVGHAIGQFPASIPIPQIAVIGAGAAGCCAAYELQLSGAQVTLFGAQNDAEVADNRPPGGRLYSSVFHEANGAVSKDLAELGAMRFPPSEDTLYYYMNLFGIQSVDNFPDPGKLPTLISYKGQKQVWNDPNIAPTGFEKVWKGWHALVNEGINHSVTGGPLINVLWAPETFNTKLLQSWTNPTVAQEVRNAWQSYLDAFGSDSFYSGLMRIFGRQHQWDVPGGEVWTAEDFSRFGALGIGSGGFGPLYNIGFNYIFRLLTNALETDQKSVPDGISELCTSFLVSFEKQGGIYKPNTPVLSVRPSAIVGKVDVTLKTTTVQTFDRVIVATTTRAMEMGLNLTDFEPSLRATQQMTAPNVGEAINRTHVASSTKLFLRTKRFWADSKYPRNILSDTKAPQVYTLEYDPKSSSGVVLVTYTWDDASTKALAFTATELLEVLKADIATLTEGTTYSDFADQLVPFTGDLDRDMRSIVWQESPNYFGAFTLARPGQDHYIDTMFRDFLKVKDPAMDNHIYCRRLPFLVWRLGGRCITYWPQLFSSIDRVIGWCFNGTSHTHDLNP